MRRLIAVTLAGLATVAALGALAGCGSTQSGGQDTVPTTPPNAVAGPVTIVRTGGIAGVNQSVEIALDGAWVYTDRKTNSSQRGTLTDAQRGALLGLVSQPGFAQQLLVQSTPPGCADGFHYEVSVGTTRGSFDDCGTSSHPAVMAVIAAISETTPM